MHIRKNYVTFIDYITYPSLDTNHVHFKIIRQMARAIPKELQSVGEYFMSSSGYQICAFSYPEYHDNRLYIKGSNRDLDKKEILIPKSRLQVVEQAIQELNTLWKRRSVNANITSTST